MADATDPKSFEEIVEWAYSTLPKKIRNLPDFPGIQVVDEPPPEVLDNISNREKWPGGTELLGLFSGIYRTKRSHLHLKHAPDLIFVFRGPILRCSNGPQARPARFSSFTPGMPLVQDDVLLRGGFAPRGLFSKQPIHLRIGHCAFSEGRVGS
jgi:predicted Zn-dependent protease with MMP-like domain